MAIGCPYDTIASLGLSCHSGHCCSSQALPLGRTISCFSFLAAFIAAFVIMNVSTQRVSQDQFQLDSSKSYVHHGVFSNYILLSSPESQSNVMAIIYIVLKVSWFTNNSKIGFPYLVLGIFKDSLWLLWETLSVQVV